MPKEGSKMITYAYIPVVEISYETQKAAHMALASARKELRLPMVKIKWFINAVYVKDTIGTFKYDRDIRGLFSGAEPDTIFVKAWQSEGATKETVYHEAFHLWQFKQGFGFGDHSEGLAQDYSADAMKRMRLYEEDEQTYLDHMVGKDWSASPETKTPAKVLRPQASERPGAASYDGKDYYIKRSYGRTIR